LHRGDAPGRIDNPSYENSAAGMGDQPYDRPLNSYDRQDSGVDRMVEEDFAIRDARQGIRHTVSELLRDRLGRPGHAGREPWKPPEGMTR